MEVAKKLRLMQEREEAKVQRVKRKNGNALKVMLKRENFGCRNARDPACKRRKCGVTFFNNWQLKQIMKLFVRCTHCSRGRLRSDSASLYSLPKKLCVSCHFASLR